MNIILPYNFKKNYSSSFIFDLRDKSLIENIGDFYIAIPHDEDIFFLDNTINFRLIKQLFFSLKIIILFGNKSLTLSFEKGSIINLNLCMVMHTMIA